MLHYVEKMNGFSQRVFSLQIFLIYSRFFYILDPCVLPEGLSKFCWLYSKTTPDLAQDNSKIFHSLP